MSGKNPPKAAPVAAFTGVAIALVFIALAVVGVHDLVVTQGWAGGHAWARAAIDGTNGATRADWVIPLVVLALVLGLVLLVTSVRPRKVTHRHVPQDPASDGAEEESGMVDVWIMPAALDTMAKSAAEDVLGVSSAHPKVSGRRTRISVATTPGTDQDQIAKSVQQGTEECIGALSDVPVKIYTREMRS